MSQPNWEKKIAAFLYRPPHAAFQPTANGTGLIEAALGAAWEGAPEELAEFEAHARGLDLPPWIDELAIPDFIGNPVVTHPLSGTEHRLDLPAGLNPDELATVVRQTIQDLRTEAGADPKRTHLLLWRLLPEKLVELRPDIPWEHLPADPRVPSHTWWEHAAVASAIAGAGSDPAVLLFTIAGAQDFVTTARRTQDSWMGSFLLSYLSWQAVKVVVEACGPDAVLSPALRGQPLVDLWLRAATGLPAAFPVPEDRLRVGNIPNIFTAIVPAERAEALAAEAEQAVRREWQRVAQAVRQAVEDAVKPSMPDIGTWGPIWDRQIPDLVDRLGVYWGVCPWGEADPLELLQAFHRDARGDAVRERDQWSEVFTGLGEGRKTFGAAYPWLAGFAAQARTARKSLRDFRQTGAEGEPGHKCTLCGQLEQLHPASVNGSLAKDLGDFWKALAEVDRKAGRQKLLGRLRKGERLCAVCLTKRLALEAFFEKELHIDHHLFPSTSTVAAGQFLLDVLDAGGEPLQQLHTHAATVDAALGKLQVSGNAPEGVRRLAAQAVPDQAKCKRLLELDGDWLYPESFQAEPLKRELDVALPEEALARCRTSAKAVKAAALAAGITPPSKYYAVVALDGDKMRDWLIGKRGPQWELLFHPNTQPTAEQTQNLKRPPGPAMHLALSDCLKAFSLDLAKPIVDDYGGALLYAGGDDVLALLPTARLYGVLGALRERFVGDATGWFVQEGEARRVLGGTRGMTVSAGVAIVHRSHDLSLAVEKAQWLLKHEAKKRLDRDAFALGLLRRSGEITETGWKFGGVGAQFLPALQGVLDLMRTGRLSTRFAYRVRGCSWAEGAADPAALRALTRHLAGQHAKPGQKDAAQEAVAKLFDLLENGLKEREALQPAPDLWESLFSLLLVTAFLSGRED